MFLYSKQRDLSTSLKMTLRGLLIDFSKPHRILSIMSNDLGALSHQSIQAALEGKWTEAINLNLLILKDYPKDIDTLNRLGRAYQETGQKSKSLECFTKVLKLDKFNTIANRNLDLVKSARATRSKLPSHPSALPIFLEEPGVTKTVHLIRLGDQKLISQLHPGDPVQILCRQHTVSAVSQSGQYLGRLPDDLSSRMRSLIQAGNTYSAWIRTNDSKILKIFIRELTRSTKYRHTPSFPLTEKLTYAAFTPPELIHEEKPDVSATEDQDSRTRDDTDPMSEEN